MARESSHNRSVPRLCERHRTPCSGLCCPQGMCRASLLGVKTLSGVIQYYENYSAMRFPYELDLSYKLPYNLEVKDFCMAVVYECVQGIEYRPFTLLYGYSFTWSVMTAGILSTIYLATQDVIYTRWMNGDLTVRSYDDLDRATLRVLTAKVVCRSVSFLHRLCAQDLRKARGDESACQARWKRRHF